MTGKIHNKIKEDKYNSCGSLPPMYSSATCIQEGFNCHRMYYRYQQQEDRYIR